MNNKAQNPLINAIIIIILIIIAISFILVLSSNVGFSIRIRDSEVPKGVDTTLFYTVENGLLFDSLNNVEFSYSVYDENDITVLEDNIPINTIGQRSTYKNAIELDISKLDRGKYTIWATIDYYIGEGGSGIGNRETKVLSLDLTIY